MLRVSLVTAGPRPCAALCRYPCITGCNQIRDHAGGCVCKQLAGGGEHPQCGLDRLHMLQVVHEMMDALLANHAEQDAIVIDEVSMVRADLLDCVDRFLRLNGPRAGKPFGGLQMIFVGDLYQLPPVVAGNEKAAFASLYETPFFYSAKVFNSFEMEFVELEKIYRQSDQRFIGLLNAIRNNSIAEDNLGLLNQRYAPEFEAPPDDFYIYLTTTNKLADEVNSRQLAKLRSRPYTLTGNIAGEFGKEYLPTAIDLQVKVGAQIMMLNNDTEGRWVNGSIGRISDIHQREKGKHVIIAELSDGKTVEITPHT